MIVYSVTINIDDNLETDWLEWMKNVHIPKVLETGLFIEHRIMKVLSRQDDETGQTYNIQYDCESMDKYEEYQQKHSQQLQKEHTERYSGKFFAFRTLLEKA